MLEHRNAFHIASGLDLDSYLSRNVLRPMLKRVERDDADRIVEPSRHEIDDDGFKVRAFNFCLAINTAPHTKAIDHEISGLISPVRHHTRHPATLGHTYMAMISHRKKRIASSHGQHFRLWLPRAFGSFSTRRSGCFSQEP